MHRVALSLTLLTLAGCTVDTRVRKLERSVEDIRAYQREQAESIGLLDSEVKLLAGKIEQLEFGGRARGGDISSLKQDLSALRSKVPPTLVPAAMLEEDEVWANGLPAETAQIFVDALGALREGRFPDALPLLQAAAEQADSSDKAGVILFWQGVAYDGLSDNKGALRSYAEVVARFPKSTRAPNALMRQADVLVRIGDSALAKDSLRKLIKDYPKTAEASEARDKLKTIA